MRTIIAFLCLLGSLSCASGESDLPPFTVRLQPEGKKATYLHGTRVDISLGLCGNMTGTCDRGGLTFFPDSGSGDFTPPLYIILSADNIPVSGGRVTSGSYQFAGANGVDIFVQFKTHDGIMASNDGGKLIIDTSTPTRLAGNMSFIASDFLREHPPVQIYLQFDLVIPQ